jgi:hypothetical protein
VENTHYLTELFILGNLDMVEKPLLIDAHIPYLGFISECGYYQGVVDTMPVHEVEAPDGVLKYIDTSDDRAGTVYH